MTNDSTRTGFGLGLDSKTKVKLESKIQVRMSFGKIYGPYTKTEVLEFIAAKRIKGEEEILVEGERNWRSISSDVDFYDALQAAVFGVKVPVKAKSKELTKTAVNPERLEAPKTQSSSAPKPEKKKRESAAKPGVEKPSDPKELRASAGQPATLASSLASPLASTGAPASASGASKSSLSLAQGFSIPPFIKPQKAKPNFALIGLIAAVAAMGFYIFTKGSAPKVVSLESFDSSLQYGRSLVIAMKGKTVRTPNIPENILPSTQFAFPEGFGAHVWAQDLKELDLETSVQRRSSAAYLARWAWDTLWLGMCVEALDASSGKDLKASAKQIVAFLESKKLMSSEAQKLFKAAGHFESGSFEGALKALDSSNLEIGQWLKEEAAWQLFWANGGKGAAVKRVNEEYSSLKLEAVAQVRSAFLGRHIAQFQNWALQLASEDPLSLSLWFSLAQANWRMAKNEIQRANRLFLTGLNVLSLYPLAWQKNYWAQYSEFLAAFARQATVAKAQANALMVSAGGIASASNSPKWWDLGAEDLDVNALGRDVLARTKSGSPTANDLATLYVLGFSMRDGKEYLYTTAQYYLFRENWSRAKHIIDSALVVDANYLDAFGELLWYHASRFEFDQAFTAYDKIKTNPKGFEVLAKFEGILQFFGREYDAAEAQLSTYLRNVPNDGLAHFFRARNFEALEKNGECVKAANLARVHGTGDVRSFGTLLFYRCRVLAKAGVSEVLKDLRRLLVDEPDNLALMTELARAYTNADVPDQAEQLLRDAVGRFPRSYELRMALAHVYEKRKDFDKAVAFYQRSKKDRPELAEPNIMIGKIFLDQQRYLEAAQNFETAGQIQPDFPEVFLFAARAYAKDGKTKEAAQLYAKEIDERPAVLASFIEAAEFLLESNSPAEVPKLFQKFKADFQDDPRVLTRLAQSYLATQDYDQAQSTAASALAGNPNLPEANRVLGYVFDQQSQPEMARQYFEKYIRLLPQAVDADSIREKLENPPYR